MSKRGERLIESAKHALAIAKDEADPSSYRVHISPELHVRGTRKALGVPSTPPNDETA